MNYEAFPLPNPPWDVGAPVTGANAEATEPLSTKVPSTSRAHILNLPDELLLEIMAKLRGVAFYLLSQTTGRFLRLSQDWRFRHYDICYRAHSIFRRRDRWGDPAIKEIFRLLRRDLFCGMCQEVRASPAFPDMMGRMQELLFCNACVSWHPKWQFSAAQRYLDHRVCIGREGKKRLCPHLSLAWADTGSQSMRRQPQGWFACAQCLQADPYHGIQSGKLIVEWQNSAEKNKTEQEGQRPTWRQVTSIRKHIPVLKLDAVPEGSFNSATLMKLLRESPAKDIADVLFCSHVRLGDCEPIVGLFRAMKRIREAQPEMTEAELLARADYRYACRLCRVLYIWRAHEGWILVNTMESLKPGNLDDPWYESTPDKEWWISGLDLASYSQHEDEEGRHITWCPDPKCYPRARFGPQSRQLVGPDEMLRMLDEKPRKFCGWNNLDGRRFY